MSKIFYTKISIFVVFILLLTSCNNETKKLPADLVNNPKSASGSNENAIAAIEFTKTEHDFGRLVHGEKVSFIYKFTNTGESDLILSKVSASCGCTASKYTKEPVKPGKEGKVEVTFDSNGQKGMVNKTVTVISNTQPQSTTLRLKAQVITPAN
jgi:hypothetical protein